MCRKPLMSVESLPCRNASDARSGFSHNRQSHAEGERNIQAELAAMGRHVVFPGSESRNSLPKDENACCVADIKENEITRKTRNDYGGFCEEWISVE